MKTVDDFFFIRMCFGMCAIIFVMATLILIDEIPGQKPISIKTHPDRYECTAYDVRPKLKGVCTVYELKEEFKK